MPKLDPDTWMWERAQSLLEECDRLQRRFDGSGARRPGASWAPPVDLYETGDELLVLVALPGVDPAAVEVVIRGGVLEVRGERARPRGLRIGHVRRLEIPHGPFERRVQLPPGTYEVGLSELQDGLLTVRLQKR